MLWYQPTMAKWSICKQVEGETTFSLFCHMLSHWFSGRDQCFRLPKMSRKVTLQHLFIFPTPFPQLIPSEIYNKCLACMRMRLVFFSVQCRTWFSYPGWFGCNFLPKTMYFKHHINVPWEYRKKEWKELSYNWAQKSTSEKVVKSEW